MKIKFYGVRGSLPSPITGIEIKKKIKNILLKASLESIQNEDTIKDFLDQFSFSSVSTYGGNTFCVEIRDIDDSLLIFEAGSGLRNLSKDVLHKDQFVNGTGKAKWIFSHTHWDRIVGFPFFVPLYIEGNQFDFYSSIFDLEQRIFYLYSTNHLSISLKEIQALIKFHHVPVNQSSLIEETNFEVLFKQTEHPGSSYAVKILEGEKSIVFTSDLEIDTRDKKKLDEYVRFFQNVDVIVFNVQYSLEDRIQKFDKGHSNYKLALDLAIRANAKKLILSHYDPSYNDQDIEQIYFQTLQQKQFFDAENKLEIIFSYENLTIEV